MALSGLCATGQSALAPGRLILTVTDENGLPVPAAQVTVDEPGQNAVKLWTDFAGHCTIILHEPGPYRLRLDKAGYYEARQDQPDSQQARLSAVMTHEQVVKTQVDVSASAPGIDPEEVADRSTMNTPEIVNVPFPTNRDIRNLLQFFPGVIADRSGQVHVAGSETWETLDTLDGFDIRSPVSGALAMRVSTDAVRSIDVQTTRYPVEFGRATGGVVAYYTGMGDDKFRFNATDFTPSFRDAKGIRFDKFVPRVTVSGPIVRKRAWFFDALETEYDNIYIQELPDGANTNELIRGSNLFKFQVNAAKQNSLTGGLLVNDYHSPYDGISPLVPQASTTKRDTIVWLPYVRDQQNLGKAAMLDIGVDVVRFRDGYEPQGTNPYEITPEGSQGSYFQSLTGHSKRVEGTATLYVSPRQWRGRNELKAGVDVDHVEFDDAITRSAINYLREDGTLLRRSTFPTTAMAARNNAQIAGFIEDRWNPNPHALKGLLIEPGLRFDWDQIVRRPLFSPRVAAVYSPPGLEGRTKVSAGVGVYYEHTQLSYLEQALAGLRMDTTYEPDGVTPVGPAQMTRFLYHQPSLLEANALNWSLGLEQRLPGDIYGAFNFQHKTISNGFTYRDATDPSALAGNFVLTNNRQDHDYVAEFEARKTFSGGYTLFTSYTRSSAQTNAALNYVPTVSVLGAQQSGPLPWDTPNRIVSWGWLPFDVPYFKKNWDFVYTLDWHTGLPITSVNANQQVVGAVGSQRFPDFVSFNPGLEWRFHLRGYYFGLRGVLVNATGSQNPATVNNNIDSPQYLTFTQPQGHAFTTRIRLIETK